MLLKNITKSFKVFLPLILSILAVIFAAGVVYAAQSYRVNNTTASSITEWSVCGNITNNSGKDIFIPTNSSAEWSAFRNNLPSGVTNGSCCTPNSYTACGSGNNRYYFDSCGVQGSLAQTCACGCSANTCTGTNTYYQDADGDGYGNAGAPTTACSQPGGYVANASDCNDSLGGVYPGGPTVCSGGVSYNGCSSQRTCYAGTCANSTQCTLVTVSAPTYLTQTLCSQPSYQVSGTHSVSPPGGSIYENNTCQPGGSYTGGAPTTATWNGSSCSHAFTCLGGPPIPECGYNYSESHNNYGCRMDTWNIRPVIQVR